MNDGRKTYLNIIKETVSAEIPDILTDFIERLETDDDWTVIIKLHALLESLASSLLADACSENRELEDLFTRLPMSNQEYGKVKFLSTLNLITKPQVKYIQYLGELRNRLVHTVSNLSFSMKTHVAKLNKDQRKSLINTLMLAEPTTPITEETAKVFLELPMLLLISGACFIVLQVAKSRLSILEKKDASLMKPVWQ